MRLLKFSVEKEFSGRVILDLLIEFSYLAAVFLVPIWFAYFFPTYNIFELNKIIVFKTLVWLLLLFTLLKTLFYPSPLKIRPADFFKKYWLIPTVFILALTLTIFSSLNPAVSFYGTADRQQGLSSYLFYFLWFVLLSFNITSAREKAGLKIKHIIVTAVISASLVAVYGILQIFNIDFLSWPEPPYLTHRAISSFGQPNFLASWLLLVIPLAIYLGYSSRYWLLRFVYILAASMQLICLFMTGSRGGLIAGLGVIGIFLIYLLTTFSGFKKLTLFKKWFVALGFIILAALSLVGLNYVSGGRVVNLLDYKSGSLAARIDFYTAAVDAIKSRPLLGYGLESGAEVFIKYYEPNWGVYGDVAQSADRAHNLVLDFLLTSGAVGLILFFILYYFFFRLAANNLRFNYERPLSLALALGVAAYLLSLMFSFTVVGGEVYLWLFLALLVGINVYGTQKAVEYDGDRKEVAVNRRSFLILKVIFSGFVVIVIFWQLVKTLDVLIADYYFDKTYSLLSKNDYFTSLTIAGYLNEQRVNPVLQSQYDFLWAERAVESYPYINELGAKAVMKQKLEQISNSLPDYSYRYLLGKARINDVLGNFPMAQDYLMRLLEITPHWPLIYLEEGKLAINSKNWPLAIQAYTLAAHNLPDQNDERLNDPHRQLVRNYNYFIDWQLGAVYETQKDYVSAGKYYQLAYQNNPDDYTLLKKISDSYYLQSDLDMAIKYSKRGFDRNPKDYHWPLALAILYHERGDKKFALDYLSQASRLAPDQEEIKSLLIDYNK